MGKLIITASMYDAPTRSSDIHVVLKPDDVVPTEGRAAWLSKHGVYNPKGFEVWVEAPAAAWEAAGVLLAAGGEVALSTCLPPNLLGSTKDVCRVSEAIYGALVDRERAQHAESRRPPPFDASALLERCRVEREVELTVATERERIGKELLAELYSITAKAPELCSPADIARAGDLFDHPSRSPCAAPGQSSREVREWLSRADKLPLRAYVREHGRLDQAERFEAGFLHHDDVLDIIREHELPLIDGMMLFPKLLALSIRHDKETAYPSCGREEFCVYDAVTVTNVPMTLDDFALFKRVSDAYRNVSGVTVGVVKHTARCKVCLAERYRYGVSARVERFGLSVAREYLLPDLSEMTIPHTEPKE